MQFKRVSIDINPDGTYYGNPTVEVRVQTEKGTTGYVDALYPEDGLSRLEQVLHFCCQKVLYHCRRQALEQFRDHGLASFSKQEQAEMTQIVKPLFEALMCDGLLKARSVVAAAGKRIDANAPVYFDPERHTVRPSHPNDGADANWEAFKSSFQQLKWNPLSGVLEFPSEMDLSPEQAERMHRATECAAEQMNKIARHEAKEAEANEQIARHVANRDLAADLDEPIIREAPKE